MKMLDIKNAENALRKLVKADLPIKIAFELSNVIDDIDLELSKLESFRVKLIKKHGKPTEDGGMDVPKENMPMFNDEFIELMNVDVDIKIKPVDIDVFEKIDNLKFSVQELKALQKIGFISVE